MIRITPTITIDESEIELNFVRSAGPGGQNVNKVSTTAQLRFDVANSPSLPDAVRVRLMALAGSRLTKEGVLLLTARRYRSQERNRQEVIERLVALIAEAATPPRRQRKTKPSRKAKERRLAEKRRRSEIKKNRQWRYKNGE